MIVTIDNAQIARMKAAIENTGKQLRKELVIAVNSTAKRSKAIIAKQIGKELTVAQKNIKKVIKVSRGASSTDLSATVEVDKEKRLNLKDYKARQVRAGVSFKVSKTNGTMLSKGAFIPSKGKYGGKVYVREGKARGPLKQRRGISPWGTFTAGNKIGPSTAETEQELKKQVDRRIRFLLLKQAGTI